MNAYASQPGQQPADFNRQVEDLFDTVSAEFHQAVRYVDTVVVPEVRRESASALRLLASQMNRLADRLDPQLSPYAPADARPVQGWPSQGSEGRQV